MTKSAGISRLPILYLALALISVTVAPPALAQNFTLTGADAVKDSLSQLRWMENYKLTMDDLRRYGQVKENLEGVARAHPDLESVARPNLMNFDGDKIEAALKGNPTLLKAVTDGGMTPRQYTFLTMVFFLSSMAMMNTDSTEALKFMRDSHLNVANLAFLNAHEKEVEQIMVGDKPAGGAPRLNAGKGRRTAQQQAAQPQRPVASEVAAALDELSQRFASEHQLIQGWFRDRTVLYYDFGSVPIGATAGRVLWPIHGFDVKGNPVAIRGQRPIFSTIPGLAGYSGVHRLAYVVTADNVQPNQLRDIAAVDALVRRKKASVRETDIAYNMPIVPRGSRLARDSTHGMLGWFEGREVQFFDFGAVSLIPTPMWRFARGRDVSGEPDLLREQNSIVDSIPLTPTYPDLWEIQFVRVDNSYVPNSLKSATALRGAGLASDTTRSVRNLPIVIVDGARVERAASPLRAFADLRSPFPPAPTPP